MKLNKILSTTLILFFISSMTFYSCSKDDSYEEEILQPNDQNSEDSNQSDNPDDSGNHQVECRYCNGSGDCPGSNCNNGKCTRCGGKGYTYSGNYKITCPWCERGKCPSCNGTGKCPKCNGTGYK